MKYLPRAIESFRSQTYQNKRLLIVQDDGGDLVRFSDEDIQHVAISRCASLGLKRNFAVSYADGDLIAHWDDDDWSREDRLQLQVGALLESRKAVTGFSRMLFWDEPGSRVRLYIGTRQYVLGTSLCYRRQWALEHPFRSLNIGEDNEFVKDAARCGQLHVSDLTGVMVATTHAGGTSPRNYSSNWTAAKQSDLPVGFEAI